MLIHVVTCETLYMCIRYCADEIQSKDCKSKYPEAGGSSFIFSKKQINKKIDEYINYLNKIRNIETIDDVDFTIIILASEIIAYVECRAYELYQEKIDLQLQQNCKQEF
jgi:hypothetical protein